jgi:putative transposase
MTSCAESARPSLANHADSADPFAMAQQAFAVRARNDSKFRVDPPRDGLWSGVCASEDMTRPLRVHIPGALYHVISRGNDRQPIFLDADDYEHFLVRLSVTTVRCDVRCCAFCLMPNHSHLLLEPNQIPLGRMMQQLNSSYCQWFNERHERVGHVLQGRYKAPMIDGDAYFRRVLRYIVRNPVRAGLVTDVSDWPWSSYRATAGLATAPSFLALSRVWSAFDVDWSSAPRLYAACVRSGDPEAAGLPDEPIAYGSDTFRARIGPSLEPYRDTRDLRYLERFACRPSLARLFAQPVDAATLDRQMHDAFEQYGYTLREIGAVVGRPPATVWRRVRRASRFAVVTECRRNEKIEI